MGKQTAEQPSLINVRVSVDDLARRRYESLRNLERKRRITNPEENSGVARVVIKPLTPEQEAERADRLASDLADR